MEEKYIHYCPFGAIVWETSKNRCPCVCVQNIGVLGITYGCVTWFLPSDPFDKKSCSIFGDLQKCVREGKERQVGPRKNMFFRKKLLPYSRTISDEKADSGQKTAHNWFARILIILCFDRFGDYQIHLRSVWRIRSQTLERFTHKSPEGATLALRV